MNPRVKKKQLIAKVAAAAVATAVAAAADSLVLTARLADPPVTFTWASKLV
ncbi:MAG: hypothetical protein ACK559_38265 [bacterium]